MVSFIKWYFEDWFQTNEETKTKVIDYSTDDCFENRIYDDLCQDILQWLPIDDKIRLRGVSRQFRQCLHDVWIQQKVLKVDNDLCNDVNNLAKGRTNTDRRTGILSALHSADDLLQRLVPFEINNFDRLLQIFPNITSLHFGRYTLIADKNKVLETIIKYCNRLQSFVFDLEDCRPELVEQFGEKFGKHLKSLEFGGDVSEMPVHCKTLLKHCPNISFLRNINFDYLFDDNEILVKDLKKFKTYDIQNRRNFEKFVENNRKLSHLSVGLNLHNIYDTIDVLKSLSKLTELKVLYILFIDFSTYDSHLSKSIKSIGLNCKKLKNFSLRVESVNAFDAKLCFESFSSFTSLKRMSFRLRSGAHVESGKLDVISLKNCRQLTHLDIKCDQIDDNFFDGIQYLFPNLRELKVKTKEEISDNSMISIAKLRRLEVLIVERNARKDLKGITDSGFMSVVSGCNDLHLFEIHNEIGISDIAIKALIRKAIRNPNIDFKYYIEDIENAFKIQQIAGGNGLPSNLIIKGMSFYKRRQIN